MIARIVRGQFVTGLLRYLYGPGRREEHTDPHLVASWDGHPEALEPETGPTPGTHQLAHLAAVLSAPLALHRPPAGGHVWHCSVRAAPEDRPLTDAEWRDIAETVLDRVGIAPTGDDGACRWVAVRHGPDHIHIVATLARQDGRPVRLSFDRPRVREACQEIERRYGLRPTTSATRVSAPAPSRGESEKAARAGRPESARDELRRRVRMVAVETHDPETFTERLRVIGLLVHERRGQAGELTGYAVALPGDRDPAGEPVYYAGGKLAPDLTLPQLARRWAGVTAPTPTTDPPTPRDRHAVFADATNAAHQAGATLRLDLSGAGEDVAHAAGDLMTAAARLVEGGRGRGLVTRAADRYDGAARSPWTPTPPAGRMAQHLRVLSWRLAALRSLGGRDEQAQAVLLLTALADLAVTIARWQQTHQRPAQTYAARQASHLLHAAASGMETRPPAGPTARPLPQPSTTPARQRSQSR